jgi:hypothetical protein
VDIKQKIRLLYQIRNVVESNGSEDVLERVENEIEVLCSEYSDDSE